MKPIIINKIDKVKSFELEGQDIYQIDVNSWFKSNNILPGEMNEIRQFIFGEWLSRKIQNSKNKINSGGYLIIICENPTDSFISFLTQKIISIFECGSCEVILFE